MACIEGARLEEKRYGATVAFGHHASITTREEGPHSGADRPQRRGGNRPAVNAILG